MITSRSARAAKPPVQTNPRLRLVLSHRGPLAEDQSSQGNTSPQCRVLPVNEVEQDAAEDGRITEPVGRGVQEGSPVTGSFR